MSARQPRDLAAYATTAGVLITFLFHAFVFGGADWSLQLHRATIVMLIAAFICGILAKRNWPLIALCLGGPFIFIDLGFYASSSYEGGDPSSYWAEILHVGGALLGGTLAARLIIFVWRIRVGRGD